MQDDPVHAVFVLVLFGDEGVIVADAHFIRAGAVTVPGRQRKTGLFWGFFCIDGVYMLRRENHARAHVALR